MGCLRVDNCCCCVDLRTGGIIVGWIGIVCSIFQIILDLTPKSYVQNAYISSLLHDAIPIEDLIANILFIIVSVLLLYGIHNKKPMFLLPNIVLFIIQLVHIIIFIGTLIYRIVDAIEMSKEDDTKGEDTMVLWLLLFLVWLPTLGLIWHFTTVIYSLYQKMKAENQHHPGVIYHVRQSHHESYKV